jgi:SHS family lactate transporter-like MFS transporter
MTIAADAPGLSAAWWREPTKDQWLAWIAAWLGWILDAFDFTIFLLIMVPIAQEFGVSVTAVAAVLTFTLWLRLLGAIGSGWLADRIGRKTPLMLSILWFSACNFIAGFSPSFTFLFVVRAILGIGRGAEWPAGATLAMESWPPRAHAASWAGFCKCHGISDSRFRASPTGCFSTRSAGAVCFGSAFFPRSCVSIFASS